MTFFIEILGFFIKIMTFFIEILSFFIKILVFSIEILSFFIKIMTFSIEILVFFIVFAAFFSVFASLPPAKAGGKFKRQKFLYVRVFRSTMQL